MSETEQEETRDEIAEMLIRKGALRSEAYEIADKVIARKQWMSDPANVEKLFDVLRDA